MHERHVTPKQVNNASGGAVVDRTLRLIEIDPTFAELAGLPAESLLGRSISEIFPYVEAPLQAFLTSEQSSSRVALTAAESTGPVVHLAPIHTSRGTIAAIELTLEPQATTLQSPSAHTVINSLFAFVGVLLPDGTLIEANRAALEAAGLTPEDVVGKPFAETFWWAYDPGVQAQLRAAVARAAQGESVRYDVPVRLAEDHFITIDFMLAPARDARGRIQYLIPSAIDVSERTRVETALRDRERHLSLALEAAHMGTWEIDLATQIVSRSASTDRLFGFEPDTHPRNAADYIERVHPDDIDRVNEAIRLTIEANVEHRVEYRVIWPDGSVHWLSSRGELICDHTGAPQRLIGALIDVSLRKKAETALAASEARFRTTFEHAPLGIGHVNRDGRWLLVNEQLCSITGYSREELHQLTFQQITHPADLTTDLALLERLLAGEIDTYNLEKRYIRKDGNTVWVNLTVSLLRDNDGMPDYFISVIEDITRRKAAEEELRFQAQLLHAVGQSVIATEFDGTVHYWNHAAEKLYGWTRAEAVGRNILDLTATDLSRQQGQAIMELLQAGEAWSGQYFVRRRDGGIFPIFVTDTPLYASDGSVIGMVGVSSDISEPLRMEAEREDLLLRERTAREHADEALSLLDTLLSTAPIGFCFISPEYRFMRVNAALAEMNGVPLEDHLGRTVREVLPDLATVIEPLFEQVLATGEPMVDVEIIEERSPEKGGRRIWRASYYPVRISDGRTVGIGIIANDITAYRASADALRLSEERFRVALQNSPITVYTTDRDLRYTWIHNPHPAFDQAQIIGRRDEELIALEEAAKLTAVKQHVLESEQGERREVQIVVAGQVYVYEITAEPLRDRNNAVIGLTVAAIDITARRQTEAALRESETRYSALAEAVPAILFTNWPDGTNDYISRNYYDYTGTPRGSGEGYAWIDQLHPDDRERTMEIWQKAVRTGSVFRTEYRFRSREGIYRWFRVQSRPLRDTHGNIIKWFGVAIDIDDTKQAAAEREELLAREQTARNAAERTAARIGQLQEVTAALSEALTPAQVADVIVTRSVQILGAASGALRLVSADGATLDSVNNTGMPGEVVATWERIPITQPVPVCIVAHRGMPLYFENRETLVREYPNMEAVVTALGYNAFAIVPLGIEGRTIGSLALTFSEPRQFAEEDRDVLLAMAGQAAQAIERARLYDAANRAVEVRDNFISVASHDLRSPLAALLGQAQLLERRAHESSPSQLIRRARIIADQTLRMNRMVGSLLDLSRIQSNQLVIDRKPLDLAALVSHVVADIQPTLYQHTVEIDDDKQELWITGDEVRLEQVFYNLIGNAVKYSPGGGTIKVTLARQPANACITVSDQGIGIPVDALPRLFEQFFRAANAGASGMGIGLYTVREIVHLHGGSVTVASEEGVGSSFTVCLPVR